MAAASTDNIPQQNKSVVLMSNIRPQDSLSVFGNPLPDQFLHPHYKHRIALSSIGLHTEFKSCAVPKNDKYPAIIQIFRKNWKKQCQSLDPSQNSAENNNALTLSMFQRQDGYFLDTNKAYSNEELHQHLQASQVFYNTSLQYKFRGYPSTYNSETNIITFGQFEMPFDLFKFKSRRQNHQTFLLFHEKFVDTLGLLKRVMTTAKVFQPWTITMPNGEKVVEQIEKEVQVHGPDLKPVFIDKELYYWFLPSKGTFVTSVPENTVHVQIPKLLYVLCSNVVPGIVDGAFQPLLKRFPLVMDADAEYACYHFKNLEFVDVVSDIADFVHITLCDELLRPIRLTPGFATQVSLIVQSRPQYLALTMNPQERFVVHINSRTTSHYPHNLPHSFTVDLPKTLHFETGLWEVALSHIVFPTRMKQLQSLRFSMSVEQEQEASVTAEEGEEEAEAENNIEHIVFPSTLETCTDIVAYFKEKVSDVADVVAWPTGPLCLTFKKKAKITLSPTLAFILGHMDLASNVPFVIDSAQANSKSKRWVFSHKPQEMQLFPASLYIYADNMCDFSFVGDRSRPLLAIVKVPHKARNPPPFVDYEIKDQVFHPLTYNHLKTLQFSIASHDDAPIVFVNNYEAVVYLTLAFRRQKN